MKKSSKKTAKTTFSFLFKIFGRNFIKESLEKTSLMPLFDLSFLKFGFNNFLENKIE